MFLTCSGACSGLVGFSKQLHLFISTPPEGTIGSGRNLCVKEMSIPGSSAYLGASLHHF